MKILKISPLVVLLFTTLVVQAQKTTTERIKFSPPKIIKNEEVKLGVKKNEYKSKQLHQGDEPITEESKSEGTTKPGLQKKHRLPPPPPQAPPPPPVISSTPPPPPPPPPAPKVKK